MKTLFSLKSRIGAILTAAALMATAMPQIAFAATASTGTELVTNGNFSKWTAPGEAITFTNSKGDVTVTHAADAVLPDNWTYGYVDNFLSSTATLNCVGTNAKIPGFQANGIMLSQKVQGIEEGESYTLAWNSHAPGNMNVELSFMHYDEETDKYMTLAEYVAAVNADDDDTNDLVLPRIGDQAHTGAVVIDYTGKKASPRGGSSSWVNNTLTTPYSLHFVAPVGVNAAEIKLWSSGNGPTQSCQIDNVSLKKSTQVVQNGGFENRQNNTYDTVWQGLQTNAGIVAADGNRYRSITTAGSTGGGQSLALKENTKYNLTFKYKETLDESIADKSPYVDIGVFNQGEEKDITPGLVPVTPVATDGDWTIYSGEFTTKEAQITSLKASGIVNLTITPRSRELKEGETWSGEMCYDDLSITEVTTLGTNFAGGISVDYSPAYAGETAEIIVAKYDPATGDFVGIEHETIGSGAKAGYFTTYVSSLASAYDVKVFLWDGLGTMKPITSTINRASTIAELPYFNDFENAAEVVGFEYDAHSYTNASTCSRCGTLHGNITNGQNGNLVVKDGALSFENSDWDGTVCFWYNNYRAEPFHNVELQFKPQTSDIIVFEFDYNLANNGDAVRLGNGFFTVFDSAGNKAAGWYGYNGDGGVYDGGVNVAGKIQGYSWAHAHKDHHFKVEVDLNNKQWTVSGTNVAKPETVYSTGDITDISKISIGLSNSTDKIDNLRIYKKITAQQADTAFTLNVGEVATAAVTYTPATETMPDLTFASSNTAIARVTPNGLITAVRAGTATITATSEMYGANLSWTVTVPDTKTVTPVELPYDSADTFATAGQEIKDLEGWTVYNRQANAVLTTADGMLVASGVVNDAKSRTTGAVQAKLAFEPVTSGKLVVEVGYKNVNREVKDVAASEGLLNIYSEDGTKIASLAANGRGDGKALNAGAWSTILNHANWQWGGAIKFVIDIDSYSYQVYQNDNLLSEQATSNSTFYLMGFDVASLDFTFSNEGDYLEYVKVYVPEEVSGDETVAE